MVSTKLNGGPERKSTLASASTGPGLITSTVALIDGPNEIVVEVEDVVGRRQTAQLPTITLDDHAPPVMGSGLVMRPRSRRSIRN